MYTNYAVGDKIHILPYSEMGFPDHVNSSGEMKPWYDTIATVRSVDDDRRTVRIDEDNGAWYWHYQNIEPASDAMFAKIDNDALLRFL